MGIDVDFGFQLFINIARGQGMDIKTYVHSQKPFIDIGFWGIDVGFVFPIVYHIANYKGWVLKPTSMFYVGFEFSIVFQHCKIQSMDI